MTLLDTTSTRFQQSLVAALLTLVVGLLAITGQSLWIDEANSALIAMPDDLAGFLKIFLSSQESDLQMPGYMVYLWVWENLFGHGEWTLRVANLPWFILAMTAVIGSLPDYRRKAWIFVLCSLIHPLIWQYLDEARPYAMQFSGATLLLLGFVMWFFPENRDGERSVLASVWLVVGAVLLSSTSLLGAIFAGFFILGWVAAGVNGQWPGEFRIRSKESIPIGLGFIGLAGLAAFYVWTVLSGAGASPLGSGGIHALGYSAYELLGFSGLGPGRLELRNEGMQALWKRMFPLMGLSAAYGWLIWLFYKAKLGRWMPWIKPALTSGWFWITMASILGPVVFLIAASEIFQFRLLGRHFIPLLPVLILEASLVCLYLWTETARGKEAVFVFMVVLIFSSLSWRSAPRHKKDDYRAAARVAREAVEEGKLVTWAASSAGAKYYGLGEFNIAYFRAGVLYRDLLHQGATDLVILSKPDLYDPEGIIRNWVLGNKMRTKVSYPAFEFFE